jgi:hypothetical protein
MFLGLGSRLRRAQAAAFRLCTAPPVAGSPNPLSAKMPPCLTLGAATAQRYRLLARFN